MASATTAAIQISKAGSVTTEVDGHTVEVAAQLGGVYSVTIRNAAGAVTDKRKDVPAARVEATALMLIGQHPDACQCSTWGNGWHFRSASCAR
jgi:hypothetical protein